MSAANQQDHDGDGDDEDRLPVLPSPALA